MKILQITKFFYPAVSFGGPVQCTYNLARYLVKAGHDVTVYATDASEIGSNSRFQQSYRLIDGIKVHYFRNLTKSYGFFVSPDMIGQLKKNLRDFDVVHLHEYRTFQNFIFYYLNKNKVPYVLSCHGEFVYREQSLDHFVLRKLFDIAFGKKLAVDAKYLLALTPSEAEQYVSQGIAPQKIIEVPNGVSLEDFSSIPPPGSFKSSFNVCGDVILYLGRVNGRKGIDILVKAFSVFSKDNKNTILVIAGPDDGFLLFLKNLVKELCIGEKVVFTGSLNRSQVIAAYNDASVVVYPSIQEGFPIVPLEAGIMGKPLIVSNDPGMDFVRKGKFGLTVEYGNVVQLTKALVSILKDPEKANELGANGKTFVMANYSWNTIGKKIENTYYNVVENMKPVNFEASK